MFPHAAHNFWEYYWAIVALNLFSFSPVPAPPLLSGNHLFVLCIYDSIFVLFIHFFKDSTYKWNHPVSAFLCIVIFVKSVSKFSIIMTMWILQLGHKEYFWYQYFLVPAFLSGSVARI